MAEPVDTLHRFIRALHYGCDPRCAMDNGRVWGFCGARRLCDGQEPAMTEAELHALIRTMPERNDA